LLFRRPAHPPPPPHTYPVPRCGPLQAWMVVQAVYARYGHLGMCRASDLAGNLARKRVLGPLHLADVRVRA
jgi:hypothetical protein